MLQLHNTTPFAAELTVLPNEHGIDTLYVMVRATFNIDNALTYAPHQPPPVAADVYWADPGQSSLKYASDLHLGKPATDIVMLGHACAPGKKETHQLDVSVSVGKMTKTVRVWGDRRWEHGHLSAPQPFVTMPMVYENAFGGMHAEEGQVSAEARNPVGKGYAGTRESKAMHGIALPNLEDPRHPIRDSTDTPPPAGFGYLAPHWSPRAAYAGTYDAAWQAQRAPFLPTDFDKRFFSGAHPDLVYPGYVQGGEPVQITNMHPKGPLAFTLPRIPLITRVRIANRQEHPVFQLETVLLEPNALQVSLVWRAAWPCDKQVLKINDVQISLTQ